jgi:hypothetical protein
VVTVTLDHASASNITMTFFTTNATAEYPDDYAYSNGTLTIQAGATSATVTIKVEGDTEDEGVSETFGLWFDNAVNAGFSDSNAVCTIIDDETIEMDVYGNGLMITNNDVTPRVDDNTEFGNATMAEGGLTAFRSPGGVVEVDENLGGTDVEWTLDGSVLSDVLTADGNYTYIIDGTFDSGDCTFMLYATNYGFSIPANATILGVQLEYQKYSPTDDSIDRVVRLVIDGAKQGEDKSITSVMWPDVHSNTVYGGPADTWGLSLTPSNINASGFGIAVAAEATAGNEDVYIDHLGLRVYYDVPGDDVTNFLEHTFVVTNSGGAEVCLTGTPVVVISGAHSNDFVVTADPATNIPGGTDRLWCLRAIQVSLRAT